MAIRLKFRGLLDRLKRHDKRFEVYRSKGKGSHLQIFHPSIEDEKKSYPLPFHGMNKDVRPGLSAIRRRFKLPKKIFEE